MTKETFEKIYEGYKKGSYIPVVKETSMGDYVKRTKITTRFVNYYHLKSVKASGKTEQNAKTRDYEVQIIPHVLKHNLNTKNDLLMVYKTNHHKAHVSYFYLGVEISEEEYYLNSGDKKKTYGDTPLFMFKLDEVVSVGGKQ